MTERKSAEVRRILERYLVEVVEAYELCPWAKAARLGREITVEIVWGTPSLDTWIDAAVIALAQQTTRVAMIVAPECTYDREQLRLLRDAVAARIPSAGVAHFHPGAGLDLSSPSRLVPFVRRSPDPLLQLVPLAILSSVRAPPNAADLAVQAQMLGGLAPPPRQDVTDRVTHDNYATVSAHRAAIIEKLNAIASDRRTSYARAGITACSAWL